ncbi:PLP-dependent aspartate aminotransferase family protein [Bacillus sp. 31A1R]|uniref:PLP-dependent aspartate aminotransferase family protein n=1 Tax=Robertmurraya mangrovi TaxID=3098077 RepID=A0ABU5J3B6_9BACI|nr:PLP-dependent aspartate aminotransferase family protein [Bacillus sp. 31A1R]MDZ5473860.1 PLP-dependent aspartate aminotransferase family protein [Bacillus sp. 31A1R]
MNYADVLFKEDLKICLHFGDAAEEFSGAAVPPIYQNSLFVYSKHEELAEAVKNELNYYVYWRGTNPTVEVLEKKLAALERGEDCKCFASGMAAITAAILASIKSGEHVLCVSHIYTSTLDLLKYLQKFNIQHSVVYSTNIEKIEQSIQKNTKLIILESPTSLTFELINLKSLAELAQSYGIRTMIDNTWGTPIFQKPLTLGFDIVVHSASKYLGGHSDVVGGALITSHKIMMELFPKEFLLMGGIMGPHEASLLLRSIRTLPFRMKEHEKNAYEVATFLENHPNVTVVNYPGLATHPHYELGKTQQTGNSGLLSFVLKDETYEAAKAVINAFKFIQIGVSWGSFESLVTSPNYGHNEGSLLKEKISPGLIRLSVGLELISEIIEDLDQALSVIS